MSPHDGGRRRGGDSIKVWREAAHMAASFTLLQITSVDLMHLKARLFLEGAGFNVDSSRTGPERLI